MTIKKGSTTHQINPSCDACLLHECAHKRAVCLKGKNTDARRALMVFTDHPDYFADHAQRPYAMDCGRLLDWMFLRMSIDPKRVAYDYTLRCYPKKSLPGSKADRANLILECNQYRFASIAKVRPRAIACLGQTTLEAFTGQAKVGPLAERDYVPWEGVVRKYVKRVWIGYNPWACLGPSASDAVSIFRTLWQAAEDANMKPVLNPSVPPFNFPTRMS